MPAGVATWSKSPLAFVVFLNENGSRRDVNFLAKWVFGPQILDLTLEYGHAP